MEEIDAEIGKIQKLIDALQPWITEKQEILDRSKKYFTIRLFGSKEAYLKKISGELQDQLVRKRELENNQEILDYEKTILKKKLTQLPRVKRAIEQLSNRSDVISMDEESRIILYGIRDCNNSIKEIKEEENRIGRIANNGKDIKAMLAKFLKSMIQYKEMGIIDSLFGRSIYNEGNYMHYYLFEAKDIIPKLTEKSKRWEKNVFKILNPDMKNANHPRLLSKKISKSNLEAIYKQPELNLPEFKTGSLFDEEFEFINNYLEQLELILIDLKDKKSKQQNRKLIFMAGDIPAEE